MIGSFFALLSASIFALHNIFLRRAVLHVTNASLGTVISVPMALPIFLLILVVSNQITSILNYPWQSYVWLSSAGVLHFVIGRSLHYSCVQIVGANMALVLSRLNIPVSVVIGISILGEPFGWKLLMGVSLIIIGITLAGLIPQRLQYSGFEFSKIPAKAFALGIGGSVAFGVSPIFIKLGLRDYGTPLSGAFIAFLAATVVLSISLLNPGRRTALVHFTGKAAGLFFISGLFSSSGNIIRFAALGLAPASVVVPLFSISPVFLLVFSFLFNRKLEIFSMPVIIGVITVVIGTILLI